MTSTEKRQALADKVISREGKNTYTQGSKRDQVANGYSDCSSLDRWAYKEVLGIDIGSNTEAQIKSKNLTTIDVDIKDGIPDESKLFPGDLLYFRGKDKKRSASDYVGHVEMYVGNGEISGHGSGIGPTRKNLVEYCRKRQKSSSPVPAGNRGLICVRRAVLDPVEEYTPEATTPTKIEGKAYKMEYKMPRLSRATKDTQSETAVKIWQSIIGAEPDGRFGPDTEAKTIAFEQAHGIYDNPHIVGPKAWAAGLAEFM